MAGVFEWLAGWISDLWAPAPGTDAAELQLKLLGAQLTKENNKPPGERDEELVHRLTVQHYKGLLASAQVGGAGRRAGGRRAGRREVAACTGRCGASGWAAHWAESPGQAGSASSKHAKVCGCLNHTLPGVH